MLQEIYVSDGEGQPYIVVPEPFKLALFDWLKHKIPCTYPRSGGPNAVLELVDTTPRDIEKYIDEWFAMLSTAAQKCPYGPAENPSSIIWRFDPHVQSQLYLHLV